MNKLRKLAVLGLAVATLGATISPFPCTTVNATVPSDLDGNYYNSDVNVSGSGTVSKILVGTYGSYKTYTSSSVTVSEEGNYDAKVFYSDGTCNSGSFVIDKTKPTSQLKVLTGSNDTDNINKFEDKTKVAVSFSDSNLHSVKVGSNEAEIANSTKYTVNLKGYSNTTVDVVATDKAGNISTVRCKFGNTKPVFSGISNGLVTNKGVTLKTTNDKDKLYVDGKYYCDEYIVNEDGSTGDRKPYYQGYLLIDEGKHTITAKSEDGIKKSIKVTLDFTKPKCSIKNGKTVKKNTKFKCSDALSGLKYNKEDATRSDCQLFYCKSGSDYVLQKDFLNPTKKYKLTKKGKYRVELKDKAGNKRTYKFKVK